MKSSVYPMKSPKRRFCGARTRSGTPCKNRPMANGRCRLHGGMSLSGAAHGRYKHGRFTREAKEQRRQLAALLRSCRDLMQQI